MRRAAVTLALIWCGPAASVLNASLQTVGLVSGLLSDEVIRENRKQAARRKAERDAKTKTAEPSWLRELWDVRGDGA